MSRDLDHLTIPTHIKAVEAQRIFLEVTGHRLLVYYTLRTLDEQATLFRQSRSTAQINSKIDSLKDRGYDFLAEAFNRTKPCDGPWRTNAAPGETWHNYGEAIDAVPLVNGVEIWNLDEKVPEQKKQMDTLWLAYGDVVVYLGMTWGGNWKSKDNPHAQNRPQTNALTGSNPELVLERLEAAGCNVS